MSRRFMMKSIEILQNRIYQNIYIIGEYNPLMDVFIKIFSHKVIRSKMIRLILRAHYPIISIRYEYSILILYLTLVEKLRQRINNYKHDFNSL
jgi:hypothetical protein